MDFWQRIGMFFNTYNTIEKILIWIFWGYHFPINIVLLIGCIYYSLKKKLKKTVMIFLVAALLLEIIRTCYIFGILSLGVHTYDIFKIYTNEKDLEVIFGIQHIMGMNSAIVEVVIIIICLIYIFSMKILRKSKIIISSFLLITLCITIFHWILIIGVSYSQIQRIKVYEKLYSDVYKEYRRYKDMHQQMKKNKIQ